MRLYAVTDRAWTGETSLEEQVSQALEGGITFLQVREKDLGEEALVEEVRVLVGLAHAYGVPCVVDDNVSAALLSGADGVHVGQSDMGCSKARSILGDAAIIGVSVTDVDEALLACEQGADYLGVGAVLSTPTKPDARIVDRRTIAAICDAVDIPVVAIGGIKEDNIATLEGLGLDGVAVVSAIFGSPDIAETCRRLLAASDGMVRS